MNQTTNTVVRLVKLPQGLPTPDIFEVSTEPLRPIGQGEFLIKNAYISIDPALISRMRPEDNYAESVKPSDIMHAYGVGEVIESKNPKLKKGTVVLGRLDMQEFTIDSQPDNYNEINTGVAKPSAFLSVMGITGTTAFLAFYNLCKPKSGETLVISASGSSVASVVVQLAKKEGCRVVGIERYEDGAKHSLKTLPYDAVITTVDKTTEQLTSELVKACPDGIDMYFDNTSGDVSEALLDLYNDFARIAVIGRLGISHLNDTKMDVGRRDNNVILAKRIKKEGFVITDHVKSIRPIVLQLAKWVKTGQLNFKEDILEGGAPQLPTAFFRMINGENNGKQLVKLADISPKNDFKTKIGRLLTSKAFPTSSLVKRIKN